MENLEQDVPQLTYGTQITFDVRSNTLIATIEDYAGDGFYKVVDEYDNFHTIHISEMEIVEY